MTKVESSPMHVSATEWAAMLARWYGTPYLAITALNEKRNNRSWLQGLPDDELDSRWSESREDVLGQLELMAVEE